MFPILQPVLCPNDVLFCYVEDFPFHKVPFLNCCSLRLCHQCSIQTAFSCGNEFTITIQFLFGLIQDTYSYVEILDSFGIEYCLEQETWIYFYSSTCNIPGWPIPFIEETACFTLCILGFFAKTQVPRECVDLCLFSIPLIAWLFLYQHQVFSFLLLELCNTTWNWG